MVNAPCGSTLAITLLAPHAVTAMAAATSPRLNSLAEWELVATDVVRVDTIEGYWLRQM